MKKLFIFAFAAIGLLACSEKNTPENGGEDQGGSTNPKEILCDPTIIEFDIAETITETITLTVNGSWSATTNVDWITIDPISGQGSSFVKITANKGKQAEGKVLFSTEKASAQVIVKRIDKYPGSFSVSENKKVYFSPGNLQYQASTNTWRFAEHQYDMIGDDNKNISSTYDGWIDLFGWGTSGYNYRYPWTTSAISGWMNIEGTNYDWGLYNAISNGGNQIGLWRTLTIQEWTYVIKNSVSATINGIKGCVLLPDGWITPEGLSVVSQVEKWGDSNNYSLDEWKILEEAGAIFLPCAGYRIEKNTRKVGETGMYWSSTGSTDIAADIFWFDLGVWNTSGTSNRENGHSVRLVKDVE